MSARQSRSDATAAAEREGVVDLDEDLLFDSSEITSTTQGQQQQGHLLLLYDRIVDLTPHTFYLSQRAANLEAQRLKAQVLPRRNKAHKKNRRKSSSSSCVPRWMFSAPSWIQFLGIGGFVLVVSSMVFLAVYYLIQLNATNQSNSNHGYVAPSPPPFYRTPDKSYPDDLPRRPTPTPLLVTAPSDWQRNNDLEEQSNAHDVATSDDIVQAPTSFPTFAPANSP